MAIEDDLLRDRDQIGQTVGEEDFVADALVAPADHPFAGRAVPFGNAGVDAPVAVLAEIGRTKAPPAFAPAAQFETGHAAIGLRAVVLRVFLQRLITERDRALGIALVDIQPGKIGEYLRPFGRNGFGFQGVAPDALRDAVVALRLVG